MPTSPISAGANTIWPSPLHSSRSALTISTLIVDVMMVYLGQSAELLGLLHRFLDAADHVERLLRQVVVLTLDDPLETANGVLQGDVLTGGAGEGLGHGERLGEEALDLAGARHRPLVLVGQLVHAENGDDVAQLLVALQVALHRARGVVVLLADHQRIELA